ncbi:unnamed protein product [Miscanthus lutarioriparius]|uniref:Uncharacterized protein n=1 Tax=Miscanthus lutarioriparius TaxID=422564 RepID=A0A811QM50_9POAL|nr:unnamed protein product [Miscanthus lutarioriparius]
MRRASPYSYAVFERLVQEHFPFRRRLFQLHALLLTSGVLLLDLDPRRSSPPPPFLTTASRTRTSASLPPPPRTTRPHRCASSPPCSPAAGAPTATPSHPSSSPPLPQGALHAQGLRRGLAADRFVACSLVSAHG